MARGRDGTGPRTAAVRRIVALALVPLAVAALSSCASPPYRFVSSAEGDVVLEVPRDWGRVSADEVREAQAAAAGQAEAQAEDDGSWVEYYDAASRPAPAHVTATTARQPVLIAQSAPLDAQVRQTLTADGLKDLLLPVSAEGRAQMAVTAAASAKEAPQFRLLSDSTVDTPTAKGVHIVFGYDFADVMEN